MSLMLTKPHRSTIYYRLSGLYEPVFAPFFQSRAQGTIRNLQLPPGAKVLEVGVGTGLSLDAYPPHADVLGIDLSPEMLARAREKIARHGWQHIELRRMDACNMEFPDNSFDYVMAFHIVSVVPNLKRLMGEISRVCCPGGTITIINHLRSEQPLIAASVDLLEPVTQRRGWHTTLTFEELISSAPLRIIRRYKTSPRSLFTIIIAENAK
jgi:phosphatidylethanolamine/phosphatidyl-N-methylethanolamine N-methyltransferase